MKSVEINFEIGSSDVKMLSIHHKRKKTGTTLCYFCQRTRPYGCVYMLYMFFIYLEHYMFDL